MTDLDALQDLQKKMAVANSAWQEARLLALVQEGLAAVSANSDDPTRREFRLSCLRYRGDAWRRLGDMDAAWTIFQQYLTEATGNGRHTVAALKRIALIHKRRGQFEAAEAALQQAQQLAESLPDQEAKATVLRENGNMLAYRGRPRDALPYYQQALSIYRTQQKTENQIYTLTDIGLAYHDMGRLDKAADFYRQGLKITQHLRHPQTGILLNNLGECYQDLFAMQMAHDVHQQALDISQQLPSDTGNLQRLLADIHRNLGVDSFFLGDIVAGRAYLQAALDGLPEEDDAEIWPQTMVTLSAVELAAGNQAEAWGYITRLREFAELGQFDYYRAHAGFLSGLYYQGQGDISAAQEIWQQARFLAHETSQRMLLWRVHARLGETYAEPALAQIHYQIAAEIIQQIIAPIEDDSLRQSFLDAAPVQAVLLHITEG